MANKQLRELYAGVCAFSTALRPSKIEAEGKMMRIRTVFVAVLLFAATVVLAAPQGTTPKDPQLIDAQGFQKLVAQYKG
jgi:hypothetical protein